MAALQDITIGVSEGPACTVHYYFTNDVKSKAIHPNYPNGTLITGESFTFKGPSYEGDEPLYLVADVGETRLFVVHQSQDVQAWFNPCARRLLQNARPITVDGKAHVK